MSDPVNRAVNARIDAYRPDTVPPFSAIEARKRSRDRRRMAAVGSAMAVVVAGGLILPSLSGGSDRLDGPANVAAPGQDPNLVLPHKRFAIRYTDPSKWDRAVDEPLVQRCLRLPGTSQVSTGYSAPPVRGVTVTGTDRITAFEQCVQDLPNVNLAEEGVSGPGQPGEAVAIDGTTYAVADAGNALTLTVPVGGGCQTLGKASVTVTETADTVTLRARVVRPPAPPPPSLPPGTQRVCTFDLRIQQVTVPLASALAGRRVIDGLTGEVLRPPGPDTDEAFIERCVGVEKNTDRADEYLGKSQSELDALAESTGTVIRVIGRDGRCLAFTFDDRPDRVNVLLVEDSVIWARRF